MILPTAFFMLLAIGYARRQLQTPALRLLKKVPKSDQGQKEKEGSQERQILPKRAILVTDLGEKIYLVFCGLWLYVFCGHGSIVLWPKRLHR